MTIEYRAQIVDVDTDEVLVGLVAASEESLEEEMGKSRWTGAIARYEAVKAEEEEYLKAEEDAVVGVGDPRMDEPEIGGHVEENPNFTKPEPRLD